MKGIVPLLVLALVQTGCEDRDRVEELEGTVARLEQENARLEELRGDLAMENEELRRELEEKDGENARLRLILFNARSAAESLENSLSMGNEFFISSDIRHLVSVLDE